MAADDEVTPAGDGPIAPAGARTRTKICGLTREVDVDAVVAAGADAVGVVVDVPVDTPREVPAERAAALVDRVPPFVTTVLVTFPDRAAALVGETGVDAVQLHGEVAPADLERLRESTGAAVVKTVDAGVDRETARRYADAADAIHLDSTDAAGAGGTGRTHDWTASGDLVADLPVPVVLAGGLTPENVAEAVAAAGPFAVDVASGVESAGGVKDHDAVRAFVDRAASAGASG
ncbi:MAG: phosphoribosylanthranilate isomerase [Halobacteriaceae archaeon]